MFLRLNFEQTEIKKSAERNQIHHVETHLNVYVSTLKGQSENLSLVLENDLN